MATYQERGGRWRAIVRRHGIKSRTKTFPTKALARVWADRVEREMAQQEAYGHGDFDGLPLTTLLDWYREDVAENASRPVSSTQRGNLTRIDEGLGRVITGQLRASDIIAHAERRLHGRHETPVGLRIPACGPATINVELGYLNSALRLARAKGKLTTVRDPVTEARPALRQRGLIAKSLSRDRRPTQEELSRLREYYQANAWRSQIPMAIIVDFAIATARRESEITRLRWSDLDVEKQTILLRDVKHPRKKQGNHKRFPLLGTAQQIVASQPRTSGEDRIFPYNSRSIGTAFTRACKALTIDDLHFHDLRHEATSRLFEEGRSIEQVAVVTLHSNWAELKRYTQIRPESLHGG